MNIDKCQGCRVVLNAHSQPLLIEEGMASKTTSNLLTQTRRDVRSERIEATCMAIVE